MDTLTRHRAPLVVLALLFLIPIGTSSLRGLTHILTCDDEIGTFLSIVPGMEPGEPPILLSSRVLEADEDPLICGALDVDLSIGRFEADDSRAELVVVVTNRSELDWRGTIQLEIGATTIPIAVGRIAAGDAAESTPWVRLPDEQLEIEGALLIGP